MTRKETLILISLAQPIYIFLQRTTSLSEIILIFITICPIQRDAKHKVPGIGYPFAIKKEAPPKKSASIIKPKISEKCAR